MKQSQLGGRSREIASWGCETSDPLSLFLLSRGKGNPCNRTHLAVDHVTSRSINHHEIVFQLFVIKEGEPRRGEK